MTIKLNNKVILILSVLAAVCLVTAIQPFGLAASAAGTTTTMGETAVLGTADSSRGNVLLAQKATLSSAATLQSLSFYVPHAVGQLVLGVHSDANGAPGSLLGSTPAFTPVTGWNTKNVSSPVPLNAGTYWLAWLPSSNNLRARTAANGSAAWSSYAFGPMPASFPGSPTRAARHWSFYATLSVGASATATSTPGPTATAARSITATATSTRPSGSTPTPTATQAPPAGPGYPLKASANHRYLVDQNNVPLLITGDSSHALIGSLSLADAGTYLRSRHAAGVNAMWVEMFCSTYSSICPGYTTYDGIAPFAWTNNDPNTFDLSAPNEAYFARVDAMVNLAAQNGITLFLDPTETGGWMKIFENNGVTKARNFGVYLGNRYKYDPNIVWLHGNDFQTWQNATDDSLIQAVANGIKSVDPNHLQTVELDYPTSASLNDSMWAPIIGLDSAYTYYSPYDQVLREYNRSGYMPFDFLEGTYEYQGYMGGYQGPHELRSQEYWTQLSGATGNFYGNANLYSFPAGWQSARNPDGSNWQTSPGIVQLGYFRNLFQNRTWYNLVPDQNHSVVTAGYGTYQSIGAQVMGNTSDYATTAITPDGSLAITYMPTVRTITVNMRKFAAAVHAQWYDPTNGTYAAIAGSPFSNSGLYQFTPAGNNAEGSGDWVLVLETAGGSSGPTATPMPSATATQRPSATAGPTASTITIGETNIAGNDDSGNGNLLVAQKATLSQPATIRSLSFYVGTASGNLRLGIYDDAGGSPHTLKAYTPEITPVVGWNTQNVTTPVALPAGMYWLVYLPQSSSLHIRMDPSGSAVWYSYAYGPLPATFPSAVNTGTYHWSFYGSLTP